MAFVSEDPPPASPTEDWGCTLDIDRGCSPFDSAVLHCRQALVDRYVRLASGFSGGTMSTPQASFNVSNVIIGVGVLSVPYALKQSGYVALLLIVIVAYITDTTGKWIGDALQAVAERDDVKNVALGARDYGFLAELMSGKRGKAFINAVTVMDLWFCMVAAMVMNGTHAKLLWPTVPISVTVPAMGAVGTACCLVPQNVYAYLSLISTVTMLAGVVAIVCASYKLSHWAGPYSEKGWEAVIRIENVPRSIGIIVYCFGGHACFPAVATRMKHPEQWHGCVDVSFLAAALCYSCFGLLGFIAFGYKVDPSVANNLSEIDSAPLLWEVAATCFLVKIQLQVPVLMGAVMSAVWPPMLDSPTWPPGRVLVLVLIGALTSAASVLWADALAAVASLAGNLCIMITAVLFPAALRVTLTRPPPGRCRAALSYANVAAAVAFGVVSAVLGTGLAVSDLWLASRPGP